MKNKINLVPPIIAVAVIIVGASLAALAVRNQKTLQAPPQINTLGPQQFSDSIVESRNHNFHPLQNFGGKRSAGLPMSAVSSEARQFANDYQKRIYPAINQWSDANQGFLPYHLAQLSEIGPVDRRWANSMCWFRMDGTMIGKKLSASEKSKGLHDVWLTANIFKPHSTEFDYIVCGWDDGKVTFVPFGLLLERPCETAVGKLMISDPAGSAGIPANTPTVNQVSP